MSRPALPHVAAALALSAALAVPASARAQAAGPPPPVTSQGAEEKKPKQPEIPSGVEERYAHDEVRTLGRLPGNILRGAVGVWNPDNLTPALIGTVASGGAYYGDKAVANAVSSPSALFGRFAETGAGPIISSSVVAGLFISGRVDKRHTRWRAVTYDMLDASLLNLAYTEGLKRLFRRERPNGADNLSFPSGHASNAFALATCFERHYGWKISLPAYLIASAVAASRLQRNAHYLSDVVGGATVGYLVGRTVARVNGRPLHPEEKKGVAITPLFGAGVRGVSVAVTF